MCNLRENHKTRKINRRFKAQSIIEYALLLAIIMAAFSAMNVYFQRTASATTRLIQEEAFAKEDYGDIAMSVVEFADFWELLGHLDD